ncbi:hypothetical protein BDP27DRAFT_1289240 [Rhodocollybia butyracea]|uniref:Uncharacterized protein n=1 Tax=Rhodocollybia butyracea TaxID=206335 RepID=A0A9P5PVS1_9AGAR|nr:hypothetical protein BDP27DRAFT_1289240 [Rhodocollybia butyracea]
MRTSEFVDLLDLSNQDKLSIPVRFDEIAKDILHNLELVLQTGAGDVTVFEVLELELYLWMAEIHEDPFTHATVEQSKSGNWYFHRVPGLRSATTSSGGYRGGTRKGLDLTFGQPKVVLSPYFSSPSHPTVSSTRGGVLLRTIRNVSTRKVVSGPSLVVDEILKLSRASKISDLVDKQWMGDMSAFLENDIFGEASRLHFRFRTEVKDETPHIYRSPRIGLDLSRHPGASHSPDDPRVVFLPKLYRYFVHPQLLTSNGRPHTFLGVLWSLVPAVSSFPSDTTAVKAQICQKSGMKAHTVTKYLEYFLDGLSCDLASFSSQSTLTSPGTYLQLIGILAALTT